MNALPLPASFDSYIRHGWSLVPIPPGSKGPTTKGWNKKENCLSSSAALPPEWGVGLAHAYSGTCALDIDSWQDAVTELSMVGIDLQALFAAPDAVTINSGNPGHGKLIYRMPFGMALPTKRIAIAGKTIYELRCASSNGLTVQDVLPPTRHPSGTTYQWGGLGNWQRLPDIPIELLSLWESMLVKDNEKAIHVTGTAIDTSWEEIANAIEHIDPDLTRDEWIDIGMALHHAGHQTENDDHAFHVWNDWSKAGQKYKGERDLMTQWRSFKADKDSGIRLGTLFKYAYDAGYRRPMPNVASLFSEVKVEAPKAVMGRFTLPPPQLDLNLIPPVLRQRAEEVSASIGCDPMVPVWAGLGAACAAADARTRLELMPGYEVPPVLWLATIGDPAEKKTPAAKPMLGILKTLEIEDRPRYAADLLTFEALDSAYSSSKKAYLAASADPANMLTGNLDVAALPHVGQQPERPLPLRLTVADVTSQKLFRMVAERPHGLLCHLDEMKGWADKMTSTQSGDDRSTWTQSYEANHHTMDRVGDGKTMGDIISDNFAVSIYGNIQPAVFQSKMAALSEDGLLQRFIPAILRPDHTKRGNPIPDHLTSAPQYEQMIRKIFAQEKTTYRLSTEAYNAFRDFQLWYEQIKADERLAGANTIYMTALGKLEGTCGRLMLVMHLMTDPYKNEVSLETCAAAIKMMKTYCLPAFRYTYGDNGMAGDNLEKWVSDHIIHLSGDVEHVTLSEIRRSGKRQFDKMLPAQADNTIIAIMDELANYGWVQLVRDDRKSVTWAINPILAEQHREYRSMVKEAKQRIYDHIFDTANGAITHRRRAV